MPTSTNREGNSAAKVFSPVPPVMAAVMATTSASLAASSASAAPKTSVYGWGAPGFFNATRGDVVGAGAVERLGVAAGES